MGLVKWVIAAGVLDILTNQRALVSRLASLQDEVVYISEVQEVKTEALLGIRLAC